jgi:quercetin dioxygenase-like cupin family protein
MPLVSVKAHDFDEAPGDWPAEARAELEANRFNGRVGQQLVSETDLVRVWMMHLEPGERMPFHRHVLNYFWTALLPGRARSRYGDGSVRLYEYRRGETLHLDFPGGSAMVHDLTNVGDTPIAFVTVEFLDSPNRPLAL